MSAGRLYDAWLFDLDGTLVDTEWSYQRRIFDRVGEVLGVEFDDRTVRDVWYGLGGDRDDVLRARGYDPERFWAVFDRLDDPEARAAATYLYEDAALVADIEGPTAVVTHCPAPVTELVLDRLGVGDWFDAVVCCSEELGFKPDPAPVRRALSALGDPEADGVLVGDGACDVGAAWNADLDGVHVERHDPDLRGHCVRADHRVTALSEWPALAMRA